MLSTTANLPWIQAVRSVGCAVAPPTRPPSLPAMGCATHPVVLLCPWRQVRSSQITHAHSLITLTSIQNTPIFQHGCMRHWYKQNLTLDRHVYTRTLNPTYLTMSLCPLAPCPPNHIEAYLDCASNYALVMWAPQAGVASYTASLVDQSGALLSCSTTNNSCRVTHLRCGQVYDVSVTHHDGVCPSMPSSSLQMDSGEPQCLYKNTTVTVSKGCSDIRQLHNRRIQSKQNCTSISTQTNKHTAEVPEHKSCAYDWHGMPLMPSFTQLTH